MKQQFRLYRRRKGGTFYLQDGLTGKQASLGTKDRAGRLETLTAEGWLIQSDQSRLRRGEFPRQAHIPVFYRQVLVY